MLRSSRLILREFCDADFDAVHAYATDLEVVRYMTWGPNSEAETRDFFVLKLGFLTGMVIASPVVVYQAWAFLAPALKKRERRVIIPSMSFGVLLFALGASFAYFLALPGTIRFLLLFGAEWFSPILTGGPYLALAS